MTVEKELERLESGIWQLRYLQVKLTLRKVSNPEKNPNMWQRSEHQMVTKKALVRQKILNIQKRDSGAKIKINKAMVYMET